MVRIDNIDDIFEDIMYIHMVWMRQIHQWKTLRHSIILIRYLFDFSTLNEVSQWV